MSKTTKYNKEQLEKAVKESITYAEVMRRLGKKWSGGQQQNLKKWIKEWNIDTSHFLGMSATKGKSPPNKRHWSEILNLDENLFFRQKTHILRSALIESGIEYVCAECKQGPIWRGKKITLQINHKNNNWQDNRKENLEFLCPNCHATTNGWSRKCPDGEMANAQR